MICNFYLNSDHLMKLFYTSTFIFFFDLHNYLHLAKLDPKLSQKTGLYGGKIGLFRKGKNKFPIIWL